MQDLNLCIVNNTEIKFIFNHFDAILAGSSAVLFAHSLELSIVYLVFTTILQVMSFHVLFSSTAVPICNPFYWCFDTMFGFTFLYEQF